MRFRRLGVGIGTGIRIKELGVWFYGVMSCSPAEGYKWVGVRIYARFQDISVIRTVIIPSRNV